MESDFCAAWTGALLNEIEKCDKKQAGSLLKGCAEYHYQINNMNVILEDYVGDLDGFINYLCNTYNWLVTYSEDKRKLLIDENKDFCVCPVTQSLNGSVSPVLCSCSENYAKKMFSKVLGKEVETKVVRSILRDEKSCVYEITL